MSLAHVVVDPAEALGRERRAGRADRPQPRQVAAVARLHAGLHAGGDVGRAGAEAGDLRALGEVPQHAHVRVAGAAVVEHDRGLGEQPGDEEVPHHPAGRGEPEDAVAGLRVDVQVELLEVLEQDPALAVDDRLRQPGGARRVQDPQRVVERDALEGQLARLLEAVLPARAVEVAEAHQPAADLLVDAAHGVRAVEVAAVVAVAVDGQQHLRLDLREAVDHRAGAEVRRAARPHGAERRGGEERRHRLGEVRDVGRHPVAAADAERPQPAGDARHLLAQLAPRELGLLAQLGGVHDRHRVGVLAAEEVLRVAHLRAREPLGARHRPLAEHAVVGALDAEELPHRAPEALEVVDRPAPQGLVVIERRARA